MVRTSNHVGNAYTPCITDLLDKHGAHIMLRSEFHGILRPTIAGGEKFIHPILAQQGKAARKQAAIGVQVNNIIVNAGWQ